MNIIDDNALELYTTRGAMKWLDKLTDGEVMELYVRDIVEDRYFRIVGMFDDVAINGERQFVIECVDMDSMFDGVDWGEYLHDEPYDRKR